MTYKHQNNFVLYSQNIIQNDATITNNDDIQSCETAKKYYSIPTISTTNHHSQRIATTSPSVLNLHTLTILPLVGKEYICFMKEGKTDQAARCIKSRIMNTVIDYVISINTFEQKCDVLKCML